MKRLIIITMLPLVFVACSNVKKTLGMERSQPDEFAVVERAPLTMPPNFNLMPPQPGAPRPQEAKTTATAQSLVLGTQTDKAVADTTAADTATSQNVDPKLAGQALDNSAESSLLSDANNAASKAVKTDTAQGNSVLKPTDEAKRLQQQNINTTTSPVMQNPNAQ
jgi:hypothetical protein